MSIAQNFPEIVPSLSLDFARTGVLDPRVTFSRASSATFYGKTVAKAEENLLLRSQEFDNASWIKSNATISVNTAVAPDGTMTADKLVENTAAAAHAVSQSAGAVGKVYSVSLYIKAAGRNFALVGNTTHSVSVDLTTGAVSVQTGTFISTGSENAGNGWWRVYFTVSVALELWVIYTSQDGVFANRTHTGDGTSGIFIWGAQLEQRSSVTAYTPTTTQAITNYIPQLQTAAAGVARFDHNPTTGESLGLLIEEQRANLLLRSEEFENAAWTKTNVTVSANTVVAPDGTLTADKVALNTASGFHEILNPFTSVSGTAYTGSYFVKAAEHRFVQLLGPGVVFAEYANFDLVSGTRTAGTSGFGAIQSVGNGWYRISLSAIALSVSVSARISLALIESGTAGRAAGFTGDGYSGIYIWGAQLEAGAFPTSYIKTEASQVTRSADSASMTGANFSSWYRQGVGSLYGEASKIGVNASDFLANLHDGTSNNRMQLVATTTQVNYAMVFNGTSQASFSLTTNTQATVKHAAAWNTDDVAGTFNGGAAATDTSASVPAVNTLVIGSPGVSIAGSRSWNGHIRKLAYYPARLPNATLQALTAS
jgi:hypothetical protein